MARKPEKPKSANRGLGVLPPSEWPGLTAVQAAQEPIERLLPGSEHHDRVRDYINRRISESERVMNNLHGKWHAAELRTQAYIDTESWEKIIERDNKAGKPPEFTQIIVPYSYAIINTVTAYMIQTFFGRRPIFQIGSYANEKAEPARMMETVLQYQSDHTRLLKEAYRWFSDGEVYGVGILRTTWRDKFAMRTRRSRSKGFEFAGQTFGGKLRSDRERVLVYSGNEVEAVDPFMFFPDPRVPMSEVNKKGEYCFWRSFEGRHSLKKLEAEKVFRWVDYASTKRPQGDYTSNTSKRTLRWGVTQSGGMGGAGLYSSTVLEENFYQVDQGTIEIIPRELGLGESTVPEKWLFTLLNRDQIIQAAPLDMDHDMHPVSVIEPQTLGWGFGHGSTADYVADIQYSISWLVNSHMFNVRAALNNLFIVDPRMVEMGDFNNPGPGGVIRLKPSAFGQDVRKAVTQLQVTDVTNTHLKDMEHFLVLGERLTSVSDNFQGIQDAGGRKTATEVRTAFEAGGSRLATRARLVSAQGFSDLTEQMAVNTQQFLDEQFYLQVVGEKGMEQPILVSPEEMSGDFYFPIHDGTLPLDKFQLLNTWKELFQLVLQDPQMRQSYDLLRMFEFIGEMGGAKQLDSMRIQVAPDQAIADAAAGGNVVPLPAGGGGNGGNALPPAFGGNTAALPALVRGVA